MSGQRKPHKGDWVAWKSHGGEAVGRVEEEITERDEVAGRTVNASPERPQYKVRSEKSGRSAVHKPQALHPRSGKQEQSGRRERHEKRSRQRSDPGRKG